MATPGSYDRTMPGPAVLAAPEPGDGDYITPEERAELQAFVKIHVASFGARDQVLNITTFLGQRCHQFD